MATYDKHYQTLALFGEPYKELVAFFAAQPTRGTILDLGCGQGRDVLALARLGYAVTGVDASKVGIGQMLDHAASENLNVTGLVADLFEFEFPQTYDVVLFDSVLHFAKDKPKEEALIRRTVDHVSPYGMIAIFVQSAKTKERYLRKLFTELQWQPVIDDYCQYIYEDKASDFRSETTYFMFIVRKPNEYA